jgi:LysR family nitrogen assimilation transcriptional regulator
VNLRRLKYFLKIVDVGSVTQASELLHIAQPAGTSGNDPGIMCA